MIDPLEKHAVITAMKKYGGSFVTALADALQRADEFNTQKIKDTWPEYWEKYLEMSKPGKE